MRVSDLAKEVGKTSKEVLDILQKNHVEVKSNLSNVTDEHIELVKKAVSGGDKPADGGKEEGELSLPIFLQLRLMLLFTIAFPASILMRTHRHTVQIAAFHDIFHMQNLLF